MLVADQGSIASARRRFWRVLMVKYYFDVFDLLLQNF